MHLAEAAPAYPVEQSTSTGGSSSQVTAHTVTLPTGYSADDVVVVVFRNAAVGLTAPAGWETLDISTTSSILLYRVMTGSEDPTITVTSNDARRSAWNAYRVSGVAVAEATFIVAAGEFSTLDPPNLTIPWGSGVGSLLLTFASTRRTANTLIAPSGYGSQLDAVSNADESSTGDVRIASAQRTADAASENPAAWGVTGDTDSPHAGVIALRAA